MKKLLSLLLAVMMALCALTPTLAEETAPLEAAPLSADSYIAAADRMAADYGGSLTWSEFPLSSDLTARSCISLGGNPTVTIAPDGSVVSIICAAFIDQTQLQACFDDFMGGVITLMGSLLYTEDMGRQEVMATLSTLLNIEVVPAVIDILTKGGEPAEFTFRGYDCRIELLNVDGQDILSLTLIVQPELHYVTEAPEVSAE